MARLDLQRGDWHAADALLGRRDGRNIGHNTRLHRHYGREYGAADGAPPAPISVRYHATDIYTMRQDGWATVYTGGWETVTTLQRINALLPGPWRIGRQRGDMYLWHAGRPVTPFVDGLSIHAANGHVGITPLRGAVPDILLSADDVRAIVAAADAAAERRATLRAERLARQHPAVRDGAESGPHPRVYSGWHWDCPPCVTESDAARKRRRERMRAEHAAGEHFRTDSVATWPVLPDGRTDWRAAPTYTARTVPACPWECPDRVGF